jgi:thymidylate kinase
MTGATARSTTLPLVAELIDRLDGEGVRYCHWKSTTGLGTALRGETDLDLLVSDESMFGFRSIVEGLGFRRFESHPTRRLPGVEDWLGLEPTVPRLVHLHVYWRLILGEDLVKNHHIPVEDVLLRETERRCGIPVPRPEYEIAILAVRALLKYREGAYLRDLLGLGKRGGLASGIRREVDDLLTRSTPDTVADAIRRDLPMLPARVILDFLQTCRDAPRDAQRLRRLRRDLEASLRSYTRFGWGEISRRRALVAVGRLSAVRLLVGVITRVTGGRTGKRKTLVGGGRTIAVIGIDGSGKSTLLQGLVELFSWRINVATFYLGSARPSPTTYIAQAWARAVRRVHAGLEKRFRERHPGRRLSHRAAKLGTGFRAVAEAQDRASRARGARRLADAGWIVLLDRYPLPELPVRGRRMDASRLPPAGDGDGWLLHRLARRERAIYRDLPRPDVALLLRVDATSARTRKAAGVGLEDKAEALERWAASSADRVTVIDASRDAEEVRRVAAQAVWEVLG